VPVIPRQAEHQFGVFTAQQAAAAGWSPDQLERAVRGGRLLRLRRAAYAASESIETSHALGRLRLGQQAVAAALRIPAATVSHASAVAVHRLALLDTPIRPCVTLPPELPTRETALHVHRQPIPTWQLDRSNGFAVTSVARSCIDLTREAGLAAGLVAADAALHRGSCTLEELAAVYDTLRGRAGLPSGRRLLDLVDGRSESPLETMSRLAMATHRLSPLTQVELCTTSGHFLARVDFYWPELGVAGEADGREKYTDQELWREKRRQETLTDRGVVVERWGWSVARSPDVLQAALLRAFRRATQLRSAGIPINVLCGPNPRT
jgi:hypothetical protein